MGLRALTLGERGEGDRATRGSRRMQASRLETWVALVTVGAVAGTVRAGATQDAVVDAVVVAEVVTEGSMIFVVEEGSIFSVVEEGSMISVYPPDGFILLGPLQVLSHYRLAETMATPE